MIRLIMLGPPGVGKGTQAKLISEKLNIPHISTGDILRAAIISDNPLGKQVKAMVENGQLVPDDIIIELVKERVEAPDCSNGFILDGFPRTVPQAKALETHNILIDAVIEIQVPEEVIIKRLTGRRIHPSSGRTYHIDFNPPHRMGMDNETGEPLIQRPDDTEETVRKRLQIYREQTEPLRKYYEEHKKSIQINGDQPAQYVALEITQKLDLQNQGQKISQT